VIDVEKCRWCGCYHLQGGVCPTVKVIEFANDGVTIRRVEFKTAQDYPQAKEGK
jgi:hypothetical protein